MRGRGGRCSAIGNPQSEPLRVLYFGGFIPLHGVPVILEAARILGPDAGVAFELVGDGQEADGAERFLAAHPLPHVRLQRCWLPEPDLVGTHIASADVCLGTFADSPKAMDVVAAKVYLAMACGKAVVTAATPAVREELLDRGQGTGGSGQGAGGVENATPPVLVVPPADPEALERALLELRDDPGLRTDVAASGRRLYEDHFRPECVVAPLMATIDGLAGV